METREILQDIISDFEAGKFVRFFRDKSAKFAPKQENLSLYNDDNFKDGKKLGEITFTEDDRLAVITFQASQPLSERSGKKAQYEKGKKILKDRQYDAGIFIFNVLRAEKIQNSDAYGLTSEKITEVNQKVETNFSTWTSEHKTGQEIAKAIYENYMINKKISKAIVAQCFAALLKECEGIKERIEVDKKLKYLVDAIKYVTE